MKISIMSQYSVEKYAMQYNDETSVIVSISSRGCSNAAIIPCTVNKIKDVLFVEFNDTDSTEYAYGGIEKCDGDKIAEFIKKYVDSDEIDKIIVNCEAGQSRSAGVAAAIMYYVNGSDKEIFDDGRYTPNRLCYRTVLNSLMNE